MVVVRESPRAKISPDKQQTQWPPKSPFQALLSSPSGRRKWQDHSNPGRERSMSPSPVKKSLASSKALQAMACVSDDDEDMDDLDEEETRAQLELARVEAKLKLDKIRRKKKLAAAGEGSEDSVRASSRADSVATSPRKALRPSTSQPDLRRANVEVPVSPIKDGSAPNEHVSPARKRLGLNAPAKALDVSLKRARDGTQVKQSGSGHSDAPRGKSFNERLRATVEQADDRKGKYERMDRLRSKGFGATSNTTGETRRRAELSNRADGRTDGETEPPCSARGLQSSARMSKELSISRSASVRSTRPGAQPRPRANGLLQGVGRTEGRPGSRHADSDSDLSIAPPEQAPPSTSSYDSFSELHLSKRHIPHVDIARAMEDKEIYTLPRLLKEVKAPHYDPPDCASDFVIFAVLASKSSPYDQKQRARTTDENKPQEDAEAPRNKFMVLKLCDLKWEVDCFLFGTAFDQFWKLTPGTLLAILNPDILPPKTKQHSGRFSLKLGSSEDCVMEIGIARDLGYCSSVRKDGQQCGDWVDKRSTEICEFHLNLFIEKQRKGRMEVNTMWRGHGHGHSSEIDSRHPKDRSREAGGYDKQLKSQRRVTQHREYGTLYSVPTGLTGKSAATLLDADDTDRLYTFAESEASRKRIASNQKERDLQRQLDKLTSGKDSVGAEYMRTRTSNTTTGTSGGGGGTRSRDLAAADARALFEKPKAADLGLLANRASGAHLSPAKDRKHHFGFGAVSSTTGREAMGWGGATQAGLLQPKNSRLGSPEKGQGRIDTALRPPAIRARSQDGSASPSKKRARFRVVGKGIREPGRESGGLADLKALGEDEEDDLEIV